MNILVLSFFETLISTYRSAVCWERLEFEVPEAIHFSLLGRPSEARCFHVVVSFIYPRRFEQDVGLGTPGVYGGL